MWDITVYFLYGGWHVLLYFHETHTPPPHTYILKIEMPFMNSIHLFLKAEFLKKNMETGTLHILIV